MTSEAVGRHGVTGEHAAPRCVEVAAGVIRRPDGAFLLGQRAPGSFYPGYWEFPGGKLEARESPADALIRELDEELGIRVIELWPWLVREHHYEHARVRLHFFEVAEWDGAVNDHVHSALSWEHADRPSVGPMLPANGPILKALTLPDFIGITHAWQIGIEAQLAAVEQALSNGLRFIQVREPGLSRADMLKFADEIVRRAHRFDARVVINGSPELASRIGADGVHLNSRALPSIQMRPDFEWVGASCHTRAELEHAAALGLDYVLLGAVEATPTHPGQPGIGWAGFSALASGLPMPVLALGGVSRSDLCAAHRAGAHGVAAIRGAWGRDRTV